MLVAYLKLTSILVLMLCIVSQLHCMAEEEKTESINCGIQRKCSTSEDIVWSTDDRQCYLFRNPCIFANEICTRRENKLEDLKVVTQVECQKYCPSVCTTDYTPVCGEHGNAYKTFGNKCNFYSYSCQQNKSYIFLQDGECPQAAVA